jgi:AcrR family transcriptional regulator
MKMATPTIIEPTNARSRRTRALLLATARAILERDGFQALTIAAVADKASVTRRTVYLHFGSRHELVAALFEYVAETEGLHASLSKVWEAPDATSALDEWAAHLARYHPRLLAVDRAVQQLWRHDPDARAHRDRVNAEKLASCRRLVDRLQQEGRLAPGWTARSARDMLFALISTDMIEALLIDRRWSRRRLASHLSRLFRSTFLTDATPPSDHAQIGLSRGHGAT